MAPMTIRDNRDIWDSPYKDSVPLVPWALPLHGGTNVPDCPDCPGCPLGVAVKAGTLASFIMQPRAAAVAEPVMP